MIQLAANQLFERAGLNLYVDGTGFHILQSSKLTHPMTLLHNGIDQSGFPLIKNGAVDEEVYNQIAKHRAWSVMPGVMWKDHREVIDRLRKDGVKVYAHLLITRYWPVNSSDRTGYQARYQDAVGDDYFRRPDGSMWDGGCPNITKPEVRDRLIALWTEVIKVGHFDGAILDWIPFSNRWRIGIDNALDWAREGFVGEGDWDVKMAAAQEVVVMALRGKFPDATLIGNGGWRGSYMGWPSANGWWRENFPYQNGGTWETNVFSGGITADLPSYYTKPCLSVLATPYEIPRARLALATACLFEGCYTMGPTDYDTKQNYIGWRLPEYGIDRQTGQATDKHHGWLGRATKPAEEIGGVWLREFVFGLVAVNPTPEVRTLVLPYPCLEENNFDPITELQVQPNDGHLMLRA